MKNLYSILSLLIATCFSNNLMAQNITVEAAFNAHFSSECGDCNGGPDSYIRSDVGISSASYRGQFNKDNTGICGWIDGDDSANRGAITAWTGVAQNAVFTMRVWGYEDDGSVFCGANDGDCNFAEVAANHTIRDVAPCQAITATRRQATRLCTNGDDITWGSRYLYRWTWESLDAGSIAGTATICQGADPAAFTSGSNGTAGLGNNHGTSFNWQRATNTAFTTGLTNVGTSSTYDSPVLSPGEYYFRRQMTGCVNYSTTTVNSNTLTIIVRATPTATVSGGTTVCQNAAGPTITFSGTVNATVTYTRTGLTGNQTINLGASGSATATAPTSGGDITYTLVSAAYTDNNPGCSNNLTGSTTVTVRPTPSATISGTTTVCQGASGPTITFNGTANVTVTYTRTVLTGNQTINLGASGSATVTAPTNIGNVTYTVVSVAYTSGVGCATNITGQSALVTVRATPTATVSGGTTVCQNAAAPTITFSGTVNATVTYTRTGLTGNQTINLGASGSATATAPTSGGDITYTLISAAYTDNNPGCSNNLSGSATVIVRPTPSASISGGNTVCQNATAPTITFSGTPNTTVVYTRTGLTGNQNINLGISGSTTITNTPTTSASSIVYTLVSVEYTSGLGCVTSISGSTTVDIRATPTASVSGATTVCEGATAPTITFSGTADATVTYTRTGLTGNQTIDLGTSGSATVTTPTNNTGNIVYTLVSIAYTNNNPGCSQSLSNNITVVVRPTPAATISGGGTYCQNNSATISVAGTPLTTVTYSRTGLLTGNQTADIPANGLATFSAPTNNAGTITYTLVSMVYTDNNPSCSSNPSGNTVVTIEPSTTVNAGNDTTLCANGAAINFSLVGASIGGGASTAAWSITSGGGSLSSTSQTATPESVTYIPIGNWTSQNIVLTLTTNDPAGPCTASNDTKQITINGPQANSTWNGDVSIDWFNSANWNNCTPGTNTEAIIPAGLTGKFYPSIGTTSNFDVNTPKGKAKAQKVNMASVGTPPPDATLIIENGAELKVNE